MQKRPLSCQQNPQAYEAALAAIEKYGVDTETGTDFSRVPESVVSTLDPVIWAALMNHANAVSRYVAGDEADVAAKKQWHRCNDISGSPLCLVIEGALNSSGRVSVRYHKKSGPVRYIRLYIASCGRAKELVYEGKIAPTQLKLGGKWKHLSYGSCWVGYLRIGNTQWTTGELVTR
jgi:hypothetical protein